MWEDLLPPSYTGPVLFLEEDHVMSTDALTALRAMMGAGISEGCHTVRITLMESHKRSIAVYDATLDLKFSRAGC